VHLLVVTASSDKMTADIIDWGCFFVCACVCIRDWGECCVCLYVYMPYWGCVFVYVCMCV